MNNENITRVLRENAAQLTPVELAELCARVLGGPLSQMMVIMSFHLAFPSCPGGALRRTAEWSRFGGPLTDDQFNEMLRDYIGKDALRS